MKTKKLNKTTKKMITLYKEGFTTKEIGKVLNHPTGNVRRRLIYHNVYKTKSEKTLELKAKGFKQKPKAVRDAIMDAALKGKTMKVVAEEFGVEHYYVRQLVYRVARDRQIKISIENDIVSLVKEVSVETPTRLPAKTVEVESASKEIATKNESSTEQAKESLCTIMLDAMIKSNEGSQVLKSKGIFAVAREIENAVDGLLRG